MTTTLTHVLPSNLTRSLVSAWSADMAIIKREKVDSERLDFLRNNPDVPKSVKASLTAWSKLVKEGCWADIPYVLGKGVKDGEEALGRMNAKGGVGLQSFPRDVRNALAQRIYWDIDISSAHPTLCRELCRRAGLPTTHQDDLLANRSERIAELMDVKECSKDTAKVFITALYFGEAISYASLPEFYKQLWTEVDNARKVITQDEVWFEALRFLNGKKKNRLGSAFSFVLQTIERECLFAMEKSAKRNGRSLDTYIHDGGLIRKREGEDEFPETLLRVFEQDIEAETGFKLTLVSKPMETSYVFAIKENSAYLEMKQKFEQAEGVFSVKLKPGGWGRVYEKELYLFDSGDLAKNYETWKVDGKDFLSLWRKDENRREYEKLVFQPGRDPPPKCFNMFIGWAVEPKQNDARVERWLHLIDNVANHDEAVREWVLNWVAHLFQRPYEKPGVALVIKGKKGSGKDTPFDQLNQLLGKMYYNTGTPEKSIFSNFNGMMMYNLLFKFEEATYKDGKANEDALKYIVTTPDLDVQQKNKDSFNVANFSRFIFTTNNPIPVITSDDERRFFFIQTSDDKRGQRAFWDETYEGFKHPDFAPALLHYLLNRDISAWKPRDYPETAYGKSVKQAFIPLHAQYFRDWIERMVSLADDTAQPAPFKEQAYKLLDKINEFAGGSKIKLSHRSLHDAIDEDYKGVVIRTNPQNKVHYQFEVSAMREHLQAKGWWVEM